MFAGYAMKIWAFKSLYPGGVNDAPDSGKPYPGGIFMPENQFELYPRGNFVPENQFRLSPGGVWRAAFRADKTKKPTAIRQNCHPTLLPKIWQMADGS